MHCRSTRVCHQVGCVGMRGTGKVVRHRTELHVLRPRAQGRRFLIAIQGLSCRIRTNLAEPRVCLGPITADPLCVGTFRATRPWHHAVHAPHAELQHRHLLAAFSLCQCNMSTTPKARRCEDFGTGKSKQVQGDTTPRRQATGQGCRHRSTPAGLGTHGSTRSRLHAPPCETSGLPCRVAPAHT